MVTRTKAFESKTKSESILLSNDEPKRQIHPDKRQIHPEQCNEVTPAQ